MKKLVKSLYNDSSGFSLVEILVVLVLVGFMLLVIANIPNSINLIGNSKSESLAKDIVSQKMEDLRNVGFLNLGGNGTSTLVDPRLSGLFLGSGEVILEDCPAIVCTSNEAAKKVTVTVSWGPSDKRETVTLTTLISEGGLR